MFKQFKQAILPEESNIEISLCNSVRSGPVNVYIHGYAAFYFKVTEEQFKQRLSEIPKYNHVFVRWPSEHFNSAILNGIMAGVSLNQFKKLKSAKSTLSTIAGPLLLVGMEALTQIKKIQHKTHLIDTQLIEQLTLFLQQQRLADRPINFIAHSFGARLLVNAFVNPLCQDFFIRHNVQDLVMMGGAICRDKVNWSAVLKLLGGKIHNCHSKSDWALAFKPDLEKNIGRYPIEVVGKDVSRIVNHHFDGFDHKSYWRNLTHVLSVTQHLPKAT